jgi:hypothetical protein
MIRGTLPVVGMLLVASLAHADGGTLRLRERAGGYQVAVFTSPAPLRAGPVDVSVLVQDAATGEVVPDAWVVVRLTVQGTDDTLEQRATEDAATNKLFRAAVFQLPAPGRWEGEVIVEGQHGPASLRFEVEAGDALPRWLDLWPWFTWPALAVTFFAVHRLLVRRRAAVTSPGPARAPGSSTGCCVSR